MSAGRPEELGRFRLLASFLGGRPLEIGEASSRSSAYSDGEAVFVPAGQSLEEQRRAVVCQAALWGAGSFDPSVVRALRGRPKTARRYLTLEGRRVLAELAESMPLAAKLATAAGVPSTVSAAGSLEVACGRGAVPDPPEWFGTIRPSMLLRASTHGPGGAPTKKDQRLEFRPTDIPEADDGEEIGEERKRPALFANPFSNSNAFTDFVAKLMGMSRSQGGGAAGGEVPVGSLRRVDVVGPNARPVPVPLRYFDEGRPGPAGGVGGALYPEWNVHKNEYRPEWCRVLDFALGSVPDISTGGVAHDEVLRRRLARLGLAPKVIRRQPDGDDIDVDALIDFAVAVRAGTSPSANVYLERRKLARSLGVLILLDASGSSTETDPAGLSVHEHQRRAAATLAATLEELGDRVAVYGFRSRGRAAVHMINLKSFGQRFGAGGRARLNQLEPAGYTRMGAAIRHAGEVLKTEAGTPNRLLLVLSDGFPYDDGYESRYAEADTHRALEEVRSDGIACLSLSIGASTPPDSLHRVFGAASHASAETLAELSPRMDELFLGALKELAVAQRRL
jgi:nitric oxide reductase NorD protein